MARGVGEHGAHGRARGLLTVRCHVISGAVRLAPMVRGRERRR
jgi:hypothetical protein